MKNLTNTLMTIAIAGSLFFSGVAVSSAELAKVVSTDREGTNTFDDFLDNPLDGDGEPEPNHCEKVGKVISLQAFHSGSAHVLIQWAPGGDRVKFFFDDPRKANTQILWDLIHEAWVRDLKMEVTGGDGPCSFKVAHIAGDLYDGGKIHNAAWWKD